MTPEEQSANLALVNRLQKANLDVLGCVRPLVGGCVDSVRIQGGEVVIALTRRPLDSEAALIPPSVDGIPVRTRIVGTLINGAL